MLQGLASELVTASNNGLIADHRVEMIVQDSGLWNDFRADLIASRAVTNLSVHELTERFMAKRFCENVNQAAKHRALHNRRRNSEPAAFAGGFIRAMSMGLGEPNANRRYSWESHPSRRRSSIIGNNPGSDNSQLHPREHTFVNCLPRRQSMAIKGMSLSHSNLKQSIHRASMSLASLGEGFENEEAIPCFCSGAECQQRSGRTAPTTQTTSTARSA